MSFFQKHFGASNVYQHPSLGLIVDFSSFVDTLKETALPTDTVKFRKANVERIVKGYKNGMLLLDNGENAHQKQWITAAGILKYVFKHSSDIAVCSALAEEVQDIICQHKDTEESGLHQHQVKKSASPKSILELYKIVSQLSLRGDGLDTFYCGFFTADETNLPTLYTVHKDHFSIDEWKKIMYFEHHYALRYGNDPQETSEVELEMRTKYFNVLCDTKKMKEELYTVNKKTIKLRNQRKDSSDERMTTQMKGAYIHMYDCLDQQLHSEVKKYSQDVEDIITIPSSKSNHVSLSFIMDKSTLDELSDVHSIASSYLIRKHNIWLDKIFVIAAKTCESYYRKELKGYARFTIYDDIITAKIKPIVAYSEETAMESDSEGVHDDSAPAKCEVCFPMSPLQPLNISSFALLQEWVMDVPLTVQLLLESSINKRYLRESTDKSRFLQPKVMKLYTCYDTMLNALNHKYIGVLQQANTLELIMHSKCLKTVFQVASGSGIAMSIASAARYLESNSIDDILYYNTYMKGHPLTYKCKGLELTLDICLRECIVILMVDNLVRLKYRDDPNPGESRSKQMNTLPITLQGIPLDSDEVASWHLPTCDGSSQCQCKESVQIPSEELVPLMVTLLPEEETASKKFSQLCTWGYPGLWKQLLDGDFLQKTNRTVHNASPSQHPFNVASDNCDSADSYTSQVSSPTACALRWEDREANADAGQVHRSPLPAVLQQTPISISKRHSGVTSCSTPVNNMSPSQQPRPFVFNTMSPLQTKHLEYDDAVLESDQYEAEDLTGSPHPDDTNCLATVIADAIRDGYDLRSEHVGEVNLFNISQEQSHCTVSDFPEEQGERPLESSSVPERFGFSKYVCPYLLTRHPPPATGKDDDPDKLREILDDLLLKMGHHQVDGNNEKIVFGPDHKIGKNLLSLRNHNEKYGVFLPEFPLLHVRKHKITILFSAYKDAGLVQLLRFMRDDEEDDWRKLLSAVHIEMATRHIRRLSASFHIAFLITFIQSLPIDQRELLQKSLENEETSQICEQWGQMYDEFMQKGCSQNATFCLHVEMMKHLGDVVAVSLAERLGGPDGYNLLLSSLKSSLLFSFLNGAVSYAPYTMQLLLEHYKASPFHKSMKMALYSTPRPGSTVNFSGDTKREMDHLDILKGFRSGSTLTSVSKRMALVDSFQEVHKHYNSGYGLSEEKTDKLGWEMTGTDWNHILPTVAVILRRGGISVEPCEVPKNVYAKEEVSLDPIILDSVSAPVGLYLLQRSACKLGLLGLTVSDIPQPESMAGPKHLVKKVASTKATTIRRTAIKTVNVRLSKSAEELAEEKRQKGISKDVKQIQRISSNMNMCQALLHPDCTKPKVNKSQTMPPALERYVQYAMDVLQEEGLNYPITLNTSLSLLMSPSVRLTAQVAIIEFAGVKYKVKASTPSGKLYLEGVQNAVLLKYLNYLPSLQRMVICEEKYEFTPDVLKSATREQRSMKASSVAHLKTGEEILCESTFSKNAIISTYEGKVMISNYLAENISDLNLHKDIELIVDSGLKTMDCTCTTNTCLSSCQKFAVPLKCTFSVENGFEKKEDVEGVKQRKGEGEMSQVDWLISSNESLGSGNSVISIVSSGDIDAVVLHLMTVALRWPRDNDGQFLNHVYVILCKPGEQFDIYCITEILRIIERAAGDLSNGVKVAVGLCIGGNDFLPKYNFYGNHSKVLKLLTSNQRFLENLVKISPDDVVTIDTDEYQEFVKQLYAPKQETATQSFEEVRQSSIIGRDGMLKSAEKWLPPISCIKKMAALTSTVIEYMLTAGHHGATLPDFKKTNCFRVTKSGKVMYDFGPDAHKEKFDEWVESLTATPVKQTAHGTIKRGQKSVIVTSRKRLFQK